MPADLAEANGNWGYVSRCPLFRVAFWRLVFWQELCATVAARCAALTCFSFCHGGMFSHGDSFHIPRFLAWDAKPGLRGLASLAPFYRVSVENRFLYQVWFTSDGRAGHWL